VFVERTDKGDAFLELLGQTIVSGEAIQPVQRPSFGLAS